MNSSTARRLKRIAQKISPEGTGTIRRQGTKMRCFSSISPEGLPIQSFEPVQWETLQRTGTRRTYQRLKRQLHETPRNMRGALLTALESYK